MKNKNNLFTNNRRNVNININKNVNEVTESITLTLTHYNDIIKTGESLCEERDKAYDKAVKLAFENEKMNKRENLLLNRISELIDAVINTCIDSMGYGIKELHFSEEELLDENGIFQEYYDTIKFYKIDVDRFKMAIQDERNEYLEKMNKKKEKEVAE